MSRWVALWILAVCFLPPAANGQVKIRPLEKSVPVNRFVVIAVEAPPEAFALLRSLDGMDSAAAVEWAVFYEARAIVFKSSVSGRFELMVLVAVAPTMVLARSDHDSIIIQVGDGPGPGPGPGPQPNIPVDHLHVMTVEDKGGARPLYQVFNSLKVQEWIRKNGHSIERRDKDDVDDNGEPVCPSAGLVPQVYFYDGKRGGKLLWQGVPKTEGEFLVTLAKYGKEKK